MRITKRFSIILISFVLILGLCACSSNNPSNSQPKKAYSIMCNDGTAKSMTLEQMKELAETNGRDFATLMENAYISGTGVVSANAEMRKVSDTSWAISITLDDGLSISYTTDIPYLTKLYTGDIVEFKGKIKDASKVSAWCEEDGYIKLSNVPEDTETIEKYEIARDIRDALYSVDDDLEFCNKYAGNTNNAGSRKFADEFVNRLRTSISSLDQSKIQKFFPNLVSKLDSLSEECNAICDLLEDMGRTNSSQNVSTIKSKAYNLRFDVLATAGDRELYKYICLP